MTKPQAAFQASYSDWRLIKGRKVVQIVLEVPLEGSDEAYNALGGMPDPSKSVWVAVARLEPEKSRLRDTPDAAGVSAARGEEVAAPQRTPSPRSHRQMTAENRLVQQAAICCNNPRFQKFLHEHGMLKEAEDAAVAVRMICNVKSRREFIAGTPAGQRWEKLYGKFIAWRDHDMEAA